MLSWLPLLLVLIGVGVTASNTMKLREAGVRTWALPMDDSAEGFIGRCFAVLIVLYAMILLAAGFTSAWPGQRNGYTQALWVLGIAFIAFGVGIVALAQREMGSSLRIGIPDETLSLITTGLFQYSRNPIFLGMMLMSLGIALSTFHTLSWMAFAVTYVTISIQIRLEEDYLGRTLGEAYRAYKEEVRRWF